MPKVKPDANPKVKKKANMPQGKKSKKNADSRCAPGSVTKLIQLLPPAARQKIVDLDFKNLLNLKLGNTNRDFTHFLMDRAKVHENTDQIEIYIREGVSIWITKVAVQKCFEFPPGTDKNLPTDSTSEIFDSLYRVLSVVEEKFNEKKKKRKEKMEKEKQVQVEEEGSEEEESGEEKGAKEGENSKVSVRRKFLTPLNINLMLKNIDKDEILKLLVKENEDTDGTEPSLDIDLIVRCFFVVVLDRLLLPQTTFYLSSATLKAVTDLDNLKTVDWSHLIFENLKSSVAECPKDKTKLILGCTNVLMVSTNVHNF